MPAARRLPRPALPPARRRPSRRRGVSYWSGDAQHAGADPGHGRHRACSRSTRRAGQPSAGFGDRRCGQCRDRLRRHPDDRRGCRGDRRGDAREPARRPRQHPRLRRPHRPQAVGIQLRSRSPGSRATRPWGNDGWKGRSGTNMWAFSAPVDLKRGVVIVPLGSPAPSYWGGERPGDKPVRQLARRARLQDRRVQVALPDRPPRLSGTPTRRPPGRCSRSRAGR